MRKNEVYKPENFTTAAAVQNILDSLFAETWHSCKAASKPQAFGAICPRRIVNLRRSGNRLGVCQDRRDPLRQTQGYKLVHKL